MFQNIVPNTDDPSFRSELDITVELTVTTEEFEDETKPEVELHYYEEEGEEKNCKYEQDDLENCDKDTWWTRFVVKDEKSGLHTIKFVPTGGAANPDSIYYRYGITL